MTKNPKSLLHKYRPKYKTGLVSEQHSRIHLALLREFYVHAYRSRSQIVNKPIDQTDTFGEIPILKDNRLGNFSENNYYARMDELETIFPDPYWSSLNGSSEKGSSEKVDFLSINTRNQSHNPLHNIWKSNKCYDRDIILHFPLMDILDEPKSFTEIFNELDRYTRKDPDKGYFSEKYLRKKINNYVKIGILTKSKTKSTYYYRRASGPDFSKLSEEESSSLTDILNFFSEAAPCGVIGSFLLDHLEENDDVFTFKHHYLTDTLYSDVMALLFDAMQRKKYVTIQSQPPHKEKRTLKNIVPLSIYISAQNGRQHLVYYDETYEKLSFWRLDYQPENFSNIKIGANCKDYDKYRRFLKENEKYIWGTSGHCDPKQLEHVEFVIQVKDNEQHTINRLKREKHCGDVEKIDEHHYRFKADVVDSKELLPWIRSFISRIIDIQFSNQDVQKRFLNSLQDLCRLYDIGGEQK